MKFPISHQFSLQLVFSFNNTSSFDVEQKILPDKTKETLIVGAGNAPFSPDMSELFKETCSFLISLMRCISRHNAGFANITNIDLSDVVIDSQMRNFPAMTWLVMDVRTMSFEGFAAILALRYFTDQQLKYCSQTTLFL